jgi:glycosyltransferase involved in cell wall biosynthesis
MFALGRNMVSISVAMATCNGAKHIRKQLDSLASQRVLPRELVVTDDCSNDDTTEIITNFANTAPFSIRIYRNETRLGYRKNFMKAMGLCTSDLIAFCDQDDFWHFSKLEVMSKPFDDPDVLLAFHDASIVTREGARIGTLVTPGFKRPIFPPLSSGPWFFARGLVEVFRSSLLRFTELWPRSMDQDIGGEPLAHDQWVFLLASVFGKIAYIDLPLVDYLQHDQNVSGWKKHGLKAAAEWHLQNNSRWFSHAAIAAKNRAELLDAAAHELDGVWRDRAEAAAKRYLAASLRFAERNKLYASKNFFGRLRAYFNLLTTDSYASGAWTFGRRTLVVDACVGVPFAPLLPANPYFAGPDQTEGRT